MREPPALQKLGGYYQLVVEKPEDLEHLHVLDEALWVATSLPTEGLTCDPVFLKYLDTDRNGRVRTDEIKAGHKWLFRMLADRGRLTERSTALSLEAIDTSHGEGRALRAAAERILANLGRPDAAEITLEEVRDRQTIVASGANNGDGIIPPGAVEEKDLAGFITDVMGALGSATDANGQAGLDAEHLATFRQEARAHLDWLERGRIPAGGTGSEVMVWGAETSRAYAALAALWDKLEEYFALSALARIDGRVAGRYGLTAEEIAGLDTGDRAAIEARLRAAPLARPSHEELLQLDGEVNPAYRQELEALGELVLLRTVGGGGRRLSRAQWEEVKRLFGPHREWQLSKGGAAVEKLGEEKLRGYLDGPLPDDLERLIREDQAIAAEIEQVQNIEKLILYQRWFMDLANNSASFPRFYDPGQRSMLEVGTLVLDGRHFGLSVKVADRASHKRIAKHSHIFLMYVDVVGRWGGKEERIEVAAAVTAGSTANLCPGKKGIFFTTDGREWDATVVDVLPNPVSLAEAVKHPFTRLAEFLGRQWEKLSASFYSDTEKGLAEGIDSAQKSVQGKAPPPAAASKTGAARDLLLGGGVAFAALGGVFTYLLKTIAEVGPIGILKVVAAVLLVLLFSTVLVAWVKLRRRNLSMILEACGWSVNAPLRLTRRIGRLFTIVPRAPQGTRRRRGEVVRALLRKVPGGGHRRLAWTGGALLAAAVGVLAGWALAGPLAQRVGEALLRFLGP